MDTYSIRNIFESTGWIKSNHYFNRYIKLIELYKTLNIDKKSELPGAIESHHILPRKLGPEYVKEKWNLVNLPARVHILAHYLLYKSVDKSECAFAFNQMWRV